MGVHAHKITTHIFLYGTLFIKWTVNALVAIAFTESTPLGVVNYSGRLACNRGHG